MTGITYYRHQDDIVWLLNGDELFRDPYPDYLGKHALRVVKEVRNRAQLDFESAKALWDAKQAAISATPVKAARGLVVKPAPVSSEEALSRYGDPVDPAAVFSETVQIEGPGRATNALGLGSMLSSLMEKQKLTKADMARFMGVSPSKVTSILTSQTSPTLEEVSLMMTALNAQLEIRIVPNENF